MVCSQNFLQQVKIASHYILQEFKIASQYIPNQKIFEFPSKLQSLVEKLLLWFRNKYLSKVQKLQRSKIPNVFPTFSDFLEEITFHAEGMNIPQLKFFLKSKLKGFKPLAHYLNRMARERQKQEH